MKTPENSPVNYYEYWITLSEREAGILEDIAFCFKNIDGDGLEPGDFLQIIAHEVIDTYEDIDSDFKATIQKLLASKFYHYVGEFKAREKEEESLNPTLFSSREMQHQEVQNENT